MNAQDLPQKPTQLRIIFILNALMTILPFIFYYVFTTQNIQIGDLDPMWMVYTGIAYILSFVVLVYSIRKRNLILFRVMFGINILLAIPASAFIGMLFAVISILLSFNGKVKAYFTA